MQDVSPFPAGRFGWSGRSPDGRLLWQEEFDNGWTFEGVNAFLNQVFMGQAVTGGFLGLIANSGFTAISSADVYNTPTGWGEWTFYTGNRPAWNPAAATSGAMVSATFQTFVMTAGGLLRGFFLASLATKTFGPGGVLYCNGISPSPVLVSVGTVVSVYYLLRLRA